MREEDIETAIKVVVVGDGAVGKSSMIQRYCKGSFTSAYKKTIGVDFLEKMISVKGNDVRLMLWDTAGQEEFDSITQAYYRGAQACVVTFSTVDRDSFEHVSKWREKVLAECGDIPMVLVQNKIDLVDSAVVRPDEAENVAKSLRVRLYRTSVKKDVNVNEVFEYLSEKYVDSLSVEDESPATDIGGTIRSSSSKKNKKNKSDRNITLDRNRNPQKKKKACFNV